MQANQPDPSRPVPKPPATGADAWKNQPTSCWPTPAAMADVKRRLDVFGRSGSGKDTDESTEHEPEPADDDAPEVGEGQEPSRRAALTDDPRVPARFRDLLERLNVVGERPVADHAQTYDAVHRDLRQSLDDVERHA